MVDGVLLLVDASEGPLPQTRFVLRKALEAQPARDPGRQQGRPARRPHRRGGRRGRTSCSWTSTPTSTRSSSRSCTRTPAPARPPSTRRRRARDLEPLFETAARAHPGARVRRGPPAAGAGHQPRRLALRRPPRAVPGAARHDPARPAGGVVPRRRHDRAGQDHRAVRDRGARPGRRRRGRARARSSPSPASPRSPSARRWPTPTTRGRSRSSRRRAQPVDDDRHQHVAARRAGGRRSSPPAW